MSFVDICRWVRFRFGFEEYNLVRRCIIFIENDNLGKIIIKVLRFFLSDLGIKEGLYFWELEKFVWKS